MNPQTPEEWQRAADLAAFFLLLESARLYGLVTGGPGVNVTRCDRILKLAALRGIHPKQTAVDDHVNAFAAKQART